MGCSSSTLDEQPKQPPTEEDVYVEQVVCKVDDLQENEMRVFEMNDHGKVLLVKQQGQFSALGTKCTHYGAPLVNGVLGNGRIRCQWHGACFNIKTGDIEDFPGLDSLPCHQVIVERGEVKVRAKQSALQNDSRKKNMVKYDPCATNKFVVIGGGPAAETCVETLRQEGFQGKITMVAKENAFPYDRVKVSKTSDIQLNKIEFRNEDFYKNSDVEVLKNVEATNVNTKDMSVTLSNGQVLPYDKLFIATGSKARKVDVPGKDLLNVLSIRTFQDATYFQQQFGPEKDVVVLGASFIAMESATVCVNKVKSVTVVGRDTVPFKKILGQEVGAAIQKLFEQQGVKFVMNAKLAHCDDNGKGSVKSVTLTDGTVLPADICIMGTGSTFYTEFLQDSGITLRPDGSIEVNEFMQTNDSTVYAGGDIAYAPVWSSNNEKATIGHFPLAHLHGNVAAKNMLNKDTPLKAVPYFWTMLFGKSFRYAGYGKFDDIIYHGDVQNLQFVAFYLHNNEVVSICSCAMDPVVSRYAERLAQGKKLYRRDIPKGNELGWVN